MGKFDGILLATDWDGTFFSGRLFDKNIEALEYFEKNGGKFTVCSGRYADFLKKFVDEVPFNTYVTCYNGAYIADLKTDEVIYEGFCDERLFDILDEIVYQNLPYSSINVYDADSSEPTPYTFEEYHAEKQTLKDKKIYKVLLRADTTELNNIGKDYIDKMPLYDYIAVRSWDLSLEILKRENAKGAALRRLAKKLGARLTVAVGDYENDIDMIMAADVGYAVENATEALKQVADRFTCSVENSAIASVIYDVERDLDNNKL